VKLRVLVGLAALAAGLLIWTAPEEGAARFTPDGDLVLPEGVERWVAVGSSLGLGYSEAEVRSGNETFHTVLLEPGAYEHYRRTGRFADGTVLALVIRAPAPRVAPARAGRVAGSLVGIEVAVKETARFPDGWAYFDFGQRGAGATARPFPPARCARCHAEHAARDNVFLQFYPLLQER
jgi:cytochrome P460